LVFNPSTTTTNNINMPQQQHHEQVTGSSTPIDLDDIDAFLGARDTGSSTLIDLDDAFFGAKDGEFERDHSLVIRRLDGPVDFVVERQRADWNYSVVIRRLDDTHQICAFRQSAGWHDAILQFKPYTYYFDRRLCGIELHLLHQLLSNCV
jgi:hypothetical protein